MKRPEKNKGYKGYKGTWAANVRLFDQKQAKDAKKPSRPIPIRTIGSDAVNDDERKVVRNVVRQFKKAEKEAKNIRPFRTMHIDKPV